MRLSIAALAAAAVLASPLWQPSAATARVPAEDTASQRALYLGVIEGLRRGGRSYAALAHLDAFDAQYPRDPRAQVLRAHCLADVGDGVGAEGLYRRLSGGPVADEAEAGLGRLYAGRDDWVSAAAQFAKAVRLRPTQAPYLYELGLALVRSGRSQEGLFRLRQAIELAPDDKAGRDSLIAALRAAGATGEADALSSPAVLVRGGER